MNTIKAKDFKKRSELEAAIRNKVDLTPTPKKDWEIVGTRVELANLGLSSKTIFWGVPCREINDVALAKDDYLYENTEFVDRGKIHDSGINGQITKHN